MRREVWSRDGRLRQVPRGADGAFSQGGGREADGAFSQGGGREARGGRRGRGGWSGSPEPAGYFGAEQRLGLPVRFVGVGGRGKERPPALRRAKETGVSRRGGRPLACEKKIGLVSQRWARGDKVLRKEDRFCLPAVGKGRQTRTSAEAPSSSFLFNIKKRFFGPFPKSNRDLVSRLL